MAFLILLNQSVDVSSHLRLNSHRIAVLPPLGFPFFDQTFLCLLKPHFILRDACLLH